MSIVNNVNLDNFRKTINKAKENPEASKVSIRIEGDWNTQTGLQFQSKVRTNKGEYTIIADEPEFLGGSGVAPSPIHYCIAGGAACYAASFAKWAAMEGIKLKSLKIKAEASMDLGRSMGISDNPILKEMKWEVIVEGDASDEEMGKVKQLADERCPALYCLTNSINVSTKVSRR